MRVRIEGTSGSGSYVTSWAVRISGSAQSMRPLLDAVPKPTDEYRFEEESFEGIRDGRVQGEYVWIYRKQLLVDIDRGAIVVKTKYGSGRGQVAMLDDLFGDRFRKHRLELGRSVSSGNPAVEVVSVQFQLYVSELELIEQKFVASSYDHELEFDSRIYIPV